MQAEYTDTTLILCCLTLYILNAWCLALVVSLVEYLLAYLIVSWVPRVVKWLAR